LLARRPKTAQGVALRSKIVLGAAQGLPNQEIARRLGVTGATVGKWRERYRLEGMEPPLSRANAYLVQIFEQTQRINCRIRLEIELPANVRGNLLQHPIAVFFIGSNAGEWFTHSSLLVPFKIS
jgi:transposase